RCKFWGLPALSQHLARDRLDVAAVLPHVFENASAHLGVVQADSDELDVEPMDVATAPQHALELLERIQGAGDRIVAPGLLHLCTAHGEPRHHESLLGFEVVVDEALGYARLLRDVLDGGVLVALAAERPKSPLKDLEPSFSRGGSPMTVE